VTLWVQAARPLTGVWVVSFIFVLVGPALTASWRAADHLYNEE
jgi:hypothetical protein